MCFGDENKLLPDIGGTTQKNVPIYAASLSRTFPVVSFPFFLIIITYNDGNRKLWWDEFAVLISSSQYRRRLTDTNAINLFWHGWSIDGFYYYLVYRTTSHHSKFYKWKIMDGWFLLQLFVVDFHLIFLLFSNLNNNNNSICLIFPGAVK